MTTRLSLAGLLLIGTIQAMAGPTGNAISNGLGQLKGPATATVVVNPPKWIYTVKNNATKKSGLIVTSFNFDLYGPAQISDSPKGWMGETDGKTFVGWITDKEHGIRPGESAKFELTSEMKTSKEAYSMIFAMEEKTDQVSSPSSPLIQIPSAK